ncbi:MAG: glycosyltransferase family 9 protein [Candidatus Omnitrophota bacterium]|nr:glycosyltransferase family 9 protein [Candidatus Omnitrophota bacterium]
MRILITNSFGIGDVIFSTPLVEILKKRYPDSFIAYLCNKRAYEVLRSDPNIDKMFAYEKDEYRDVWKKSRLACFRKISEFMGVIKKEHFDIAIDLSLGYQCSLFLMFAGIKKRIGFNYRNRGRFLTDKIDIDAFSDKHVIEYYLDILKLLKIDHGGYPLKTRVYLTDSDSLWADEFLKVHGVGPDDRLVGIIPGCGASWGMDARYRRWDRENFAKVADQVIERYGVKVLLLGDPKEVDLCDNIQGAMKHEAISSCGKTSLRNFLGLLNRCALVVTNDGGPLHMAVGLGVKTVSIFGPVDEKIYGPYPPGPNHIVVSNFDMPCRPCYRKFKYTPCEDKLCLKLIGVEDVLLAVEKHVSKNGALLR